MEVVCEAIEFEAKLNTLREELKILHARLEKELATNQALRAENEAFRSQNESLHAQNVELAKENTKWCVQLTEWEKANNNANWENACLRAKVVRLQNELHQVRECNHALEKRYFDLLSETGNACRDTYKGLRISKRHIRMAALRGFYDIHKLIRRRFDEAHLPKCSVEAALAMVPPDQVGFSIDPSSIIRSD